MAQYTVFYKDDTEKEIQQAYNGVCDNSDFIAHFTGLGCKSILVESEDTPNTHYYINDAEDGVTKRGIMDITMYKTICNVDDVVNKKVEYQWCGAPKWWDKRAFITKNGKEVENIERNTQKRYGLLRLAKLLCNIFPKETGKDTYPIQLTFNLKNAEIYVFRFE